MRRKQGTRLLSLLLCMILLAGLLPMTAFAVQESAFVLVAEADGKLVIPPEYVHYTEEQTIAQALQASGHRFEGLEDGMVSAIDGVVGEYTRSDEAGEFDLAKPASQIRFFRFSEESAEACTPGAGLQKLMTVMADYALEPADVRAAAAEAYHNASTQFAGVSEETANTLAVQLDQAIKDYRAALEGSHYTVTFQTEDGASILAENAFGRVWKAEKNAKTLSLPAGNYSFCVEKSGVQGKGSFQVADEMTIAVELPKTQWMQELRLSGSYGEQGNDRGQFSDDELPVGQWMNRELTVPVWDTFVGAVYVYARCNVGDMIAPKLSAVYTAASNGTQKEQSIPLESWTSGVSDVLKQGTSGNQIVFRLSAQKADGYTYCQDYTVHFSRKPTLSGIKITDQTGMDQVATEKFDGQKAEYVYKVTDEVTSVTVSAEGFAAGYDILVNGQKNGAIIPLNRDVSGKATETKVEVAVRGNGYENVYGLTIRPGEGKNASFRTEAGVTLEVVNQNGVTLPYKLAKESTTGAWQYKYVLVDGVTYNYVATKDTYYHAADAFVLSDLASGTLTKVDVPTDPWLNELDFGSNSSAKYRGSLPMKQVFQTATHAYELELVDTTHQMYVWVDAAEDVTVEARYNQLFGSDLYHGKAYSVALTQGNTTGAQLRRFLMNENPWENTVTIRLSKAVDGITFYQEYPVKICRKLTLKQITAICDGQTVILEQAESGKTGFAADIKNYNLTVPLAAEMVELSASAYAGNLCYGEADTGYRILADGVMLSHGQLRVPLDGSLDPQTVMLRVENEKAPQGSSDYAVHILKSPPVFTTIQVQPANAVLMVYMENTGERIYPDAAGTYSLCEGFRYQYALTRYGYVARSGVLEVTRDEENRLVVADGQMHYEAAADGNGGGAATIQWNLQSAPANTGIDPTIRGEWTDFRGAPTNNGVTAAPIPTAAEDGTLYWAKQLGQGFDADAVGSPILVDGDVVTYAGDKLYRIDPVSGEVTGMGVMDHKSSFSITPAVYAEGMIFVALSNGTVQAFNAKTLESLWLYRDPLGGQPNCPITVKNGYLYTGFWNSENKKANYICLSITDEDPGQSRESKTASWHYSQLGGFYWAGAYVGDNYLIVGTDDGASGYSSNTSRLLLLDPRDGTVLDSWESLHADVRSTVVYDAQTDAYYFTSKGGTFYSTRVVYDRNHWKFSNQWAVELENGVGGVPMSTCSPVVYNGRAYVGVSGSGQFTAYSGHNITVIDLAQRRIAYRVETQGYPQTSGLLTTAYEAQSGYVYIYFFDNMTPGKLRVLRDRPGQTSADYLTEERGKATAYALFTPTGDQAQYAICSPITDEYGTVYFKNDSAQMMAFGSKIVELSVTKQPDRVEYAPGEVFDPAGMVITATYANGKTRDVTAYVSWNTEALRPEDTLLTISFDHVMYHNAENGAAMNAGVKTETPTAVLELTVTQPQPPEIVPGDVNGDGEVGYDDAQAIAYHLRGAKLLDAQALAAADVNGDGEVTYEDAQMIAYIRRGVIPGDVKGAEKE